MYKLLFLLFVAFSFQISLYAQQTGFDEAKLLQKPSISEWINEVVYFDFDNDNDLDIIYITDSHTGWIENLGNGIFSKGNTIQKVSGGTIIRASDFNQDGLIDLIVGNNNFFYIYQNERSGDFTEIVLRESVKYGRDIAIGDIDNDGDLDIASIELSEENLCKAVNWYENISDSNVIFKPGVTLSPSSTRCRGSEDIEISDIDNDGLLDVIAVMDSGIIVWYKNLGDKSFSSQKIVTTQRRPHRNMISIDVNEDNKQDIVVTDRNTSNLLVFTQLTDSTFSDAEVIFTAGSKVGSLKKIEINGDHIPELIINEENIIRILKKNEYNEYKDYYKIITSVRYVSGIDFIDLNQDSLNDISFFGLTDNSKPRISFIKSMPDGSFYHESIITSSEYINPLSVAAADLNLDGNQEIVSGGEYKLSWYELNPDNNLFRQYVIEAGQNDYRNIKIADLNSDGYPDIVYARTSKTCPFSCPDSTALYWQENQKGMSFKSRGAITPNERQESNRIWPKSVFETGDLDNDGDIDILYVNHEFYNDLYLLKNSGSGKFDRSEIDIGLKKNITDIHFYDFDGDDDLDVFISPSPEIGYLENIDGNLQNYNSIYRGSAVDIESFQVFDFNNNSIPDIIYGAYKWYWEFGESVSSYGLLKDIKSDLSYTKELISDTFRAHKIKVADLDNDGFMDIITLNSSKNLSWQKNYAGKGFSINRNLSNQESFFGDFAISYLNNDEYPEIILTSEKQDQISWYLNKLNEVTISTDPQNTLPATTSLHQNYPNPFNPITVIRYQLPVSTDVQLEVFDLLGRKVATLVNGRVSAGEHQVSFDASRLSSGVYIYRIKTHNFVQTRQMTLIK